MWKKDRSLVQVYLTCMLSPSNTPLLKVCSHENIIINPQYIITTNVDTLFGGLKGGKSLFCGWEKGDIKNTLQAVAKHLDFLSIAIL